MGCFWCQNHLIAAVWNQQLQLQQLGLFSGYETGCMAFWMADLPRVMSCGLTLPHTLSRAAVHLLNASDLVLRSVMVGVSNKTLHAVLSASTVFLVTLKFEHMIGSSKARPTNTEWQYRTTHKTDVWYLAMSLGDKLVFRFGDFPYPEVNVLSFYAVLQGRQFLIEEIAEKLCESVAVSLEGKKLGSFTRISSAVQAAMEEALLRILTPKRSIDILRDVHAAKEQSKPYVVVFVGVNGVGKSTNLAKVAYWLLQHDVSVMMAACDTFRSGAVEQLRTHARRLKIPIFEKGYEKDPAVVAKEAIEEASRNNSDVVLVDTAGRMQGILVVQI
eukprot:Gb_28577 [translate_table: standard]